MRWWPRYRWPRAMAATVEPRVRWEVTITRADGTVEPVQVITNEAPTLWQRLLTTNRKGQQHGS